MNTPSLGVRICDSSIAVFLSAMTLLIVLFCPHKTYAQRTCGTMEVHERLLQTDPNYAKNRAAIEDFTRDYRLLGAAKVGVVSIPVVVHVVWNTFAQNISAAQVASQIAVLNEDYRKLNADWSTTPDVWEPLVADAQFEFCLATRDPVGCPSNGITRTWTGVPGFGTNDAVKFAVSGGHDAWPRDAYLNIWVCHLVGGLLGYAQFPGGPAEKDGVVIDFEAFGDTGTAKPPFDKGRTSTHEIGHWLNLFHIWGDDCPGLSQCDGSDFVADTPNQECDNHGCPTFPSISCGNGPNGDMFMNYMDYVDDACMVMFTAGQSTRMDATIDGARLPLQSSEGCGEPIGPCVPDLSLLGAVAVILLLCYYVIRRLRMALA